MELLAVAGLCVQLGLVGAVMPCPLAANIAAVSFLARRVSSPAMVLLSGALFAAGQLAVYLLLGALIGWAAMAPHALGAFLQRYISRLIGPLMILAGIAVLQLIPLGRGLPVSRALRRAAESLGLAGAALLGVALALAFCPTTAMLFFGQVVPLAVRHGRYLLLPAAYGVGAAVPVIVTAWMLAFAANRIAALYHRLEAFEKWARRVTGCVLIAAGFYEMLA